MPTETSVPRLRFRVGDRVECFCCGIGLKDWEWTDNAYAEHRRWSKDCPYAQLVGQNSDDVTETQDRCGEKLIYKQKYTILKQKKKNV